MKIFAMKMELRSVASRDFSGAACMQERRNEKGKTKAASFMA
jgi:hypothetical protein